MSLFKRILSGTTAIAMIATFFNGGIMPLQKQETNFTVYAEETANSGMCGENVTWILDDEGTLTISGTGAMSNWDRENCSPWRCNEKIKNVVIQDGVQNIGNDAFYGCERLRSVSISNSVISIGDTSFYLSGIASITIPDSVISIGKGAFWNCGWLTSITIPNSVTNIGENAFWNTGLISVTLPDSITRIESMTFYKCQKLTSITIPNSITSIEGMAFFGCSNLTSVVIPDSVEKIGEKAFWNCENLASVTLPDNISKIEEGAFYYCPNLTAVVIKNPECDMYMPFSVEIFDEATTIYGYSNSTAQVYAEKYNRNFIALDEEPLETALQTNTTTSMTKATPASTKATTTTSMTKATPASTKATTTTSTTKATPASTKATTTTSTTKATPASTKATTTTSTTKVTTTSDKAATTTSTAKVTTTSAKAATTTSTAKATTTSTKAITTTSTTKATTTSTKATTTTSTTKATITSNKETTIISTTDTEKIIDSGTCGDNLTWTLDDKGTLIISGTGKMTNWDNWYDTNPWYDCKETITKLVIENGVTSIGNFAFVSCSSLTSVTIPDSVTSIGFSAFVSCTSLTSVTIPDSVTSIDNHAFNGCSSLTSVTIPDNVSSIGYRAFFGTPWLKNYPDDFVIGGKVLIEYKGSAKSITIPDGVTSIGNYAFQDCSSLTSVMLPDSVTSIGNYAFQNCSSLTSVTIPNSVSGIGDWAFYNTPWLKNYPDDFVIGGKILIEYKGSAKSITIPDGVTSIGNYAFQECSSLTSVTLPDSVTSIGNYAFQNCSSLTSVTIDNPYCKIYGGESTIPSTVTIYSYPNSIPRNYAEKYGKEFIALAGEVPVQYQYSYEVIPLLPPFNEYFFVKTDNPDPYSFCFADKESVYSEYSFFTLVETVYADINYEDKETFRVNGGYIFKSFETDGGEISLLTNLPVPVEIFNLDTYERRIVYEHNEIWEDIGLTFTLPKLCDEKDYLIDTYATKSDFFENMDAVQEGFSSICLYSGSYIRGKLYHAFDFWAMSNSPHIDQSFYIQSPYSREGDQNLFASAIYPFRYDSLGFPSMMARISKRLNGSSSYKWSDESHADIIVTYDGKSKVYGGQGNGKGKGITEDKISHFFTFDDNETITLENSKKLLDTYANIEMEDDVPKDDAITWEKVCDTVGDGAWVHIIGIASIIGGSYECYSYLYKKDDRNYFCTDILDYDGGSLYWWGSLGYASDTWVDGRYVDEFEDYVPGATFEEHPESDIILLKTAFPVINYECKYEYNADTGKYEYVYSNIEINETTKNVRYSYNKTEKNWKADSDYISYTDYNALVAMTEQGLVDEKYLKMVRLTYDDVVALNVDKNTNKVPEQGYIYDRTVAPGTKFDNTVTETTETEETTTTIPETEKVTTIETTTTAPKTEKVTTTETTTTVPEIEKVTTAETATTAPRTEKVTTTETTTIVPETEKVTTAETTTTISKITETEPVTTNRVPGDADRNGKINMVDVIKIRKYIVNGTEDNFNESNADVDANGKINMVDVIKIRQYIVNGDSTILK